MRLKRCLLAVAVLILLPGASLLHAEDGVIDLAALPNYAKQAKPSYIFWDNTAGNPTTNTGATLGRLLFYDKRLSRNDTVSCSSCHQQAHAFGNPAVAGTGVNGTTARHPMRLVNARFGRSEFLSDRRAPTLEVATTRPLHSTIEMGFSGTNGDPDFAELIAKISALPEYRILFAAAFGSSAIDETSIQKALAQFIRSIESFDSKYDAGAVNARSLGDPFPNFTESENRGKQLFSTSLASGGAFSCSGCHLPPHFSNATGPWNNGVVTAIGGGTDFTVTTSSTLRDLFHPSGQLNGPMMHDGSFTSISQVLDHYSAIPPGIPNTFFPQGMTLNLTPQDRADLEAFLRTLSGNNVYTDPKWSNPFRPDGTITVKPINPPASQTMNLSTRMHVLSGSNVGIGGFIITGVAPKRVLVRALGPSLDKFGLTTLLADPRITLQGAGFGPLLNEGWRSDQEAEIKATGLAPGDDREPAIIATLNPGSYTAILSGTDGGTGTGILEIYDLDPAADSKLANLSTRAFAGSGDDTLIAGFTVGKEAGADDIIVRGLGWSLRYAGVNDELISDPDLEVRNANGATLATNDAWTNGNDQEDIRTLGLQPVYGNEPIIVTSLGPGAYTALLSPAPLSRYIPGIALIEIYSRGHAP